MHYCVCITIRCVPWLSSTPKSTFDPPPPSAGFNAAHLSPASPLATPVLLGRLPVRSRLLVFLRSPHPHSLKNQKGCTVIVAGLVAPPPRRPLPPIIPVKAILPVSRCLHFPPHLPHPATLSCLPPPTSFGYTHDVAGLRHPPPPPLPGPLLHLVAVVPPRVSSSSTTPFDFPLVTLLPRLPPWVSPVGVWSVSLPMSLPPRPRCCRLCFSRNVHLCLLQRTLVKLCASKPTSPHVEKANGGAR